LLQAYSVLFLGLIVALFFAFWALGAFKDAIKIDGKGLTPPDTVGMLLFLGFFIVLGAFVGLVGWTRLNYVPYEIYLFDSGIVEFKRYLDSVTINATEIYVLKQRLMRGENGDVRELRIQHVYGQDTIGNCYWLDDFVAHLLSLNPTLIVEGSWTI
jgi:hypothetical protein